MKIQAPAKVNLYLAILGRLPNGYHELETVFHTVSLSDTLEVVPAPKISLKVTGPQVPKNFPIRRDNIVWRAAAEFIKAFGVKGGLKISLRKNIPVQAGLGGGSTDAAAVLTACSKLFLKKCGNREKAVLHKIAKGLGADVPFFLEGGCAVAGGIGEKLKKLPPARFHAVIVKPKIGLSTPEVYGWYDQTLDGGKPLTPAPEIRKILSPLRSRKPSGAWAEYLFNSFEDVVFMRAPEVGRIKSALIAQGCYAALLSGSGSALFGLVKSKAEGEKISRKLRSQGLKAWAVQAV